MGPHKYSIWSIGQLKGIFPQVPKPIYYFFLILKMKKIHLTSLDHSLQHIPQCSWDFGLLFLLVCMFFSWSLSRLHRMPSIWTNCPICSNGHAFFWYSKIAISCLCIFEVLFPVPCCGQSKSIQHWTFKIGDHSTIQYNGASKDWHANTRVAVSLLLLHPLSLSSSPEATFHPQGSAPHF